MNLLLKSFFLYHSDLHQNGTPKKFNNKSAVNKKQLEATEPTDEEKYFDDQFNKWEEEFECWKKQNANHQDRQAYAEYEKKFIECRTKLLERRELMRKRKQDRMKPHVPLQEIKQEPQEIDPQPNDPFEGCNQQNIEKSERLQSPKTTINFESIFKSNTETIPGLGFDDPVDVKKESEAEFDKDLSKKKNQEPKALLDLSKELQKAPITNDLAKQISALLENPQVVALLTLVNLTTAKPNSIQANALKPVTDALRELTGKNTADIMRAIQKATIERLNINREPTPPPSNVTIAASGITVAPPIQPVTAPLPPMDYSAPPLPSTWPTTTTDTSSWNAWPAQNYSAWNTQGNTWPTQTATYPTATPQYPTTTQQYATTIPQYPTPTQTAAYPTATQPITYPTATQPITYPTTEQTATYPSTIQGSTYSQPPVSYTAPPPTNTYDAPPPPSKDQFSSKSRSFSLLPPGGDDFFRPSKVIDYSKKDQPPSKSKTSSYSESSGNKYRSMNIVDYGHGDDNSSSNDGWNSSRHNDNFFKNAKTIDYGHSDANNRGNNNRNNNNNYNNRKMERDPKLDYGESNPSYPGKWLLTSERPPLIKRTKRGKRKNRKGQIIESKKWPKKNYLSDNSFESNLTVRGKVNDVWKPSRVIDYSSMDQANKLTPLMDINFDKDRNLDTLRPKDRFKQKTDNLKQNDNRFQQSSNKFLQDKERTQQNNESFTQKNDSFKQNDDRFKWNSDRLQEKNDRFQQNKDSSKQNNNNQRKDQGNKQIQTPNKKQPLSASNKQNDTPSKKDPAISDKQQLTNNEKLHEDQKERTPLDVSKSSKYPYPQSTTVKLHKKKMSLDEILLDPGRQNRAPFIALILRGPPGSGKSSLARIIKDQETAIGGSTPRILSIDDYYTDENELDETDPITGKIKTTVVSSYEYDANKEDTYMDYLLKNFKKTVTDKLFNFIIVDAWNHKLHHYFEFCSVAEKNGYIVSRDFTNLFLSQIHFSSLFQFY